MFYFNKVITLQNVKTVKMTALVVLVLSYCAVHNNKWQKILIKTIQQWQNRKHRYGSILDFCKHMYYHTYCIVALGYVLYHDIVSNIQP